MHSSISKWHRAPCPKCFSDYCTKTHIQDFSCRFLWNRYEMYLMEEVFCVFLLLCLNPLTELPDEHTWPYLPAPGTEQGCHIKVWTQCWRQSPVDSCQSCSEAHEADKAPLSGDKITRIFRSVGPIKRETSADRFSIKLTCLGIT